MNFKYSLLLFGLMLFSSCKSSDVLLSGEKKLYSFTLEYNKILYNGEIDDENKTVNVKLPWNTYLADLKCKVQVSPKATYSITDSTDFSKPQVLTITAEDKSIVDYNISVTNAQRVNLTDERIEIEGCLHVNRDKDNISMSRFNVTNLAEPRINYMQNGQTQTGVIIRFTTNSNYVKLRFTEIPGARWGTEYGVWADEVWHNKYTSHGFTLQKPIGRDVVTWEITPSLMNAVKLTSIEIENVKELLSTNLPAKPQYFAIGNSITQGVGQGNAGYLSYPFVFGRKMGYETYNLGVGGSKVSWKVASELQNQRADLITVLWGYNDWYFVGESAENYRTYLLELINKIREFQPNTPLICISLIGTENPTPSSGVRIEAYRDVVKQLVNNRISSGDKNIYYLDGSNINIELMDKVHPSVKGASDFAVILENFVKVNILNK